MYRLEAPTGLTKTASPRTRQVGKDRGSKNTWQDHRPPSISTIKNRTPRTLRTQLATVLTANPLAAHWFSIRTRALESQMARDSPLTATTTTPRERTTFNNRLPLTKTGRNQRLGKDTRNSERNTAPIHSFVTQRTATGVTPIPNSCRRTRPTKPTLIEKRYRYGNPTAWGRTRTHSLTKQTLENAPN